MDENVKHRSVNTDSEKVAEQLSIGQLLQEKRCGLKLSQEEIAHKLKLSVRQIEALEQDDYHSLPSMIFIRGFVKSYARALGLDPELLLEKLKVVNLQTQAGNLPNLYATKAVMGPGYHQRRMRRYGQFLLLIISMILLLVIAGNAILQYLSAQPDVLSKKEAGNDRIEVNLREADLSQPLDKTGLLTETVSTSEVVDTVPGVVVATSTAAQKPAANTLQIQTTQDSWIRVIDANKEILFEGMVLANTTRNLGGSAPYFIVVGNAMYTTLRYEDKNVDLAAFTQNNVAKLEVK